MNYNELALGNLIRPIEHLIGKTLMIDSETQKITPRRTYGPGYNWMQVTPSDSLRHCGLWHEYYFNYYGIIPRACRTCWKATVTLDTLRDMHQMSQIQEMLGIPSKVGWETRPYTGKIGKYPAFWYLPLGNLYDARKELLRIEAAVHEFFPSHTLILKRGCTEFERKYPPSDRWDQFADRLKWDAREDLLDTLFNPPHKPLRVADVIQTDIWQRAIEWAFEHGDATYRDFCTGDFSIPIVNYNGSIHADRDYSFNNVIKGEPNDRNSLEVL